MEYYDPQVGRTRETLEQFLRRGESREDIVFGKRHEWAICFHDGVGSRGSHSLCDKTSLYLTLTHQVSATDGTERYFEGADDFARRILERRRDDAERMQ